MAAGAPPTRRLFTFIRRSALLSPLLCYSPSCAIFPFASHSVFTNVSAGAHPTRRLFTFTRRSALLPPMLCYSPSCAIFFLAQVFSLLSVSAGVTGARRLFTFIRKATLADIYPIPHIRFPPPHSPCQFLPLPSQPPVRRSLKTRLPATQRLRSEKQSAHAGDVSVERGQAGAHRCRQRPPASFALPASPPPPCGMILRRKVHPPPFSLRSGP